MQMPPAVCDSPCRLCRRCPSGDGSSRGQRWYPTRRRHRDCCASRCRRHYSRAAPMGRLTWSTVPVTLGKKSSALPSSQLILYLLYPSVILVAVKSLKWMVDDVGQIAAESIAERSRPGALPALPSAVVRAAQRHIIAVKSMTRSFYRRNCGPAILRRRLYQMLLCMLYHPCGRAP